MFGAVAPRPNADGLSVVIHGLHQSVVDSQVKVVLNAILMPSEHPCEISQGFKSAVGGPPEPPFELLCRPVSPFVNFSGFLYL